MKSAQFSSFSRAFQLRKGTPRGACEPARFFPAVFFWFLIISSTSSFPVLAALPKAVVINEMEYNPKQTGSDSAYEWFELYNRTSIPLDLVNWTITDNSGKAELLPPITIDANGFHVFAASGSIIINYPGIDSALGSSLSFWTDSNIGNSLANDGDHLILEDGGGNLIDKVGWGNDIFVWDPAIPAVTGGHSIERLPYGLDNDSASDFVDQANPSPGSGITPTPTLPPTPTPTPTATPVPTATPTPTNVRQIGFLMSSDAQIGQSFNTSISLSSFNANTLYYIKALIGKDSSSMTDGRTLGADSVTWLAWNASWSKMPQVQTDNAGLATATVSVKTDDDIEVGNYQMVIRVKEANGTELVDSSAKTISVVAPTSLSAPTATPAPTPKSTSSSSKSGSGKTVGSIKTIKQLSDGSAIETEGLVSVPFGVLGLNYFYLDDGEAGIMIKSDKKIDLKLGQRIKVASTIEESYGEKYIKTSDITIINDSKNPPIPKSARGNQINEDLEGKLISVSGRIFETAGNVFWINDGYGDIKIYIKSSTGIKIARKKVGDYVKINGILSQWGFDDDEKPNYRMLPRFQSDVLISSAPIGGVGQVLGVATLPKTGTSLSELPIKIWQDIILRTIKFIL